MPFVLASIQVEDHKRLGKMEDDIQGVKVGMAQLSGGLASTDTRLGDLEDIAAV